MTLALAWLWVLAALPASAADVTVYELYKGKLFTQSAGDSPAPAVNLPYFFQTIVTPVNPAFVTNPIVKTPAKTNLTLALSE
jgi:hypothetical protein